MTFMFIKSFIISYGMHVGLPKMGKSACLRMQRAANCAACSTQCGHTLEFFLLAQNVLYLYINVHKRDILKGRWRLFTIPIFLFFNLVYER